MSVSLRNKPLTRWSGPPMNEGKVVTYEFGTPASNTCYVDHEDANFAYVTHPLAPCILIRALKSKINQSAPNGKDSTERCLDYASANQEMLDYNTLMDLTGLKTIFAIYRKLTPKQKQVLAHICGMLAQNKFSDDLKLAMSFVSRNVGVLDEFNLMWYNNFKGLFTGKQPVTSKKQRSAIFNIAGYALAELETPSIPK
jgi:hypothetical protein